MNRFLPIALLFLAACNEPGDPVCAVAQTFNDTFVTLGQEVTVRAGISVSCFVPNVTIVDRPLRVVKEVEVEVLDPDNKRVAAKATAPERSGGNTIFDVTSDVTFVLDKPGPWTVIVRFEPNVGRSQQRVRTLDVRADAGIRELPTDLPGTCTFYGLTASGRPVCTLPTGMFSSGLELAIGPQRFAGQNFAIDGDAVWAMGVPRTGAGLSIDRLAPNDAGLYDVTHRFPLTFETGPSVFTAGRGMGYRFDAFAQNTEVQRLRPLADGGFESTMLSLGVTRRPAALAPAEDRVLVFASSVSGGAPVVVSLFPDGGAEVVPSAANQQPIANDDGALFFARFDAMGRPSILAAADATTGVVRQGTLDANLISGLAQLPLSPQVPTARVTVSGGTMRVVVPLFGDGELGIEAFDVPSGYGPIVGATRRHAFARSTDGTKLLVIDR